MICKWNSGWTFEMFNLSLNGFSNMVFIYKQRNVSFSGRQSCTSVLCLINMDKQLEDLAHNCTKFHLAAKSLRKSELFSWPVPDSPWSHLHIDFAGPINGKCFLLLVDAWNFPDELHHLWGNHSKITVHQQIQTLTMALLSLQWNF